MKVFQPIKLICLGMVGLGQLCFAGMVTPTTMSVKLNNIYFMDLSNYAYSAYATPSTINYSLSDPDFGATPVTDLTIPEGRFIGIGLDISNTRSIYLDGNHVYQGEDGTYLNSGDTACSTGSATDGSGIRITGDGLPCIPITVTIPGTASPNVVSFTYFSNIVCITIPDRKSSICEAGDTFVDASVPANLQVSIMIDMLDAIEVDPTAGAIKAFPTNPFAFLGLPAPRCTCSTFILRIGI